jgi:hypothetical protein
VSGIDDMLETLRALEASPEECGRDIADLLGGRMRTGSVVPHGEDVAIVPGGRSDAFLSDAWSEDVEQQMNETLTRIGGGT